MNVEETENVAARDDEVEIKSVFEHFEHVFKLEFHDFHSLNLIRPKYILVRTDELTNL